MKKRKKIKIIPKGKIIVPTDEQMEALEESINKIMQPIVLIAAEKEQKTRIAIIGERVGY